MGMPKIEFRLQMFRGDWDQIWSQQRLLWLMEGLCRVNQTHLRQMNAFKERGLIKNSYPTCYRSGLHYETEKGTEIWPDIPSLLSGTMGKGLYPGPWGDCLPVSTLVLKDDYTVAPIGGLVPGDRIMGDGGLTTVVEHAITGEKPILAFELNNGSVFKCSPEHRIFLADGSEIRAEDVKPSMLLRTPTSPFPEQNGIVHSGNLSPEDFAWLIGVFVADGWAESERHHRFAISGKDGHKKEEQKRKVQALAEKAGLNTRWHERYIAVNDRELAEYMTTCGHLAPNKHLPSLAMTYPQVRSALEGLKADASTASSGTITHGTTSEILALQLRILYRMLGQSVHIKRWDEHGGLGTHPMYRVTVRRPDSEVGNHQSSIRNSARVVAIRELEPELCADITTDTGRFYLPESDIIVHNCEDLACYRVAEYRELPWHYERISPATKKTEYADPRFPQGQAEMAASKANKGWPGWKKVKGGVKAKPFAKWRRGPGGNYHYHALTMLPGGELEDPSLVLGMGREKQFAADKMAEKLRDGSVPVLIQYAKKPDVMVVDPEKPSGYAGGKGIEFDKKVLALLSKGHSAEALSGILGDVELGAFMANEIPLGEGEFDVDALIGWSRSEGRFSPKSDKQEISRLLGYAKH